VLALSNDANLKDLLAFDEMLAARRPADDRLAPRAKRGARRMVDQMRTTMTHMTEMTHGSI
jgi:hypothetical protein